MGILSGLARMGLGNLEKADLYAKEEEKQNAPEEKKKEPSKSAVEIETELIFDKTYDCPCCGEKFTSKTVKNGKAKLIRQDKDLRPIYQGIDPLKYDVVSCPKCGFSALTKFFGVIAQPQVKLIKENISRTFKRLPTHELITYEEALHYYKLALANTIVKKGKDSEKAYTCLRMAWVVRGMREELDEKGGADATLLKELKADEAELLHNALEGFVSARQTEHGAVAGMDQNTLDYLLAVLYLQEHKYEESGRLVSSIITSASANPRIKDKARDLKDEILKAKGN